MKPSDRPKIAIFGGGITGLTIAHECVEAGMEVHVYEGHAYCGGKVVSKKTDHERYIEHGYRGFQHIYSALFETMKRIPYYDTGRSVFDNLIPAENVLITAFNQPIPGTDKIIPDAIIPVTISAPSKDKSEPFFRNMRECGLNKWETVYFMWLLAQPILRCKERQLDTLYKKPLDEYCHFEKRSKAFIRYIEIFAQSPTSSKPYASAIVPIDAVCRGSLLGSILNRYGLSSSQNFLNGPASERFIFPWVKHLENLGVTFHVNSPLERLITENQQIKEAVLKDNTVVKADAYVSALPYYIFKKRIGPILNYHHHFEVVFAFSTLLFLKKIPTKFIPRQIGIVYSSSWLLSYWLEKTPEVWKDVSLGTNVEGILSVAVSHIKNPGKIYQLPLTECNWDQFKEEILAQLDLLSERENIVDIVLDPYVRCLKEDEYQANKNLYEDWEVFKPTKDGYRWLFESPPLYYTPEVFDNFLQTTTAFSNLFLAGDFVHAPHLVQSNMERANFIGKQCAQAICSYFNKPYDLTKLEITPYPLAWARKIDAALYKIQKLFRKKQRSASNEK